MMHNDNDSFSMIRPNFHDESAASVHNVSSFTPIKLDDASKGITADDYVSTKKKAAIGETFAPVKYGFDDSGDFNDRILGDWSSDSSILKVMNETSGEKNSELLSKLRRLRQEIDTKYNHKLQLKPKVAPQLILKNSPHRINLSSNTLRSHPEIKQAINEGTVNPVMTASVLFSKQKTVYSPRYQKSTSPKRYREYVKDIDDSEASREDNANKQNQMLPFYKRVFVDPQIPFVISLYLQLLVNLLLISVVLYFISIFLLTIRTDINNKIETQLIEITQEIALCAREYERNHCSPEKRVPALELSCMTWEKCMSRDPKVVGRAKIGAETFAEIINGFIKPISWKSIIFFTVGIVGSLILNNAIFDSYRHTNSMANGKDSQQYDVTQSPQKSPQKLLTDGSPPLMSSSFLTDEGNENTYGTPFKKSMLFNTSFLGSSPLRLTPKLSPSLRALRRKRDRFK